MSLLHRSLNWAAATFNDLPLWRGERRVWSLRMQSLNFERWLYLWAHRLGLMGREDQALLARNVRPGMRIMDVGSNLGLYALTLARLAGPEGHVICFEPDPALFAVFRRNCALNGLERIESHNLALGSRHARLTLHKMIINSGDNHFSIGTGEKLFRESVEAEVVALDEYLPGLALDFIKIDVQGWELEALQGMRRTLEANRQVRVYFQFSPGNAERAGSTSADVIAFLRSLGFRILDAATGAELDDPALAALAGSLKGWSYTNLIAAR